MTPTQLTQGRSIADIVCVQNRYNLAHREDDAMIEGLARNGIAYVPFFPLGGFSPLQSVAHLRENLAAGALELPDEAMTALNAIAG